MQIYLVTFASTHAALAFEGCAGGEGALVPVPPALRAGCGMAWRLVRKDDEAARSTAAEVARQAGLAELDWELYAKDGDAYRSVAAHGADGEGGGPASGAAD